VLALIANLIPYKGHADLLHALALVKQRLPRDWTMLCVGRDDGIGGALAALARDLGLARHLRWLGPRDDVPALLAASDIGLLCSHQEGFANSILEGMAARLPMVVTDVGGNGEAVCDGETGLVVPPRDPARLAEAIVALARDPARRRAMGAAGRRRVAAEFSIEACVSAYERLYEGLIAAPGRPVQALIDGKAPMVEPAEATGREPCAG
jgi:glycosyltransferase involved in cell wall biosynthesis